MEIGYKVIEYVNIYLYIGGDFMKTRLRSANDALVNIYEQERETLVGKNTCRG